LSSESLQYFSSQKLQKLNDFQIIVNGNTFEINFSLFCCVSGKFLKTTFPEKKLACSIPENFFSCFISFLDIFHGFPFYFENYSFEALSYLIDLFGLSSLFQFICDNIPVPKNVNESIEFLSKCEIEFFPSIFEQCIMILNQHIDRIKIEQFNCLPNFILERLFRSKFFQIENVDFLFKLIN
jgi:hypothetical protein